MIAPTERNIIFFWDGDISPDRLQILKDSLYTTRVFNQGHPIYLFSNTLVQSQFDAKVPGIEVVPWNWSMFKRRVPIESNILERYENVGPRQFSDLFRLMVLWLWGGSYIDTDDIGIRSISDKKNVVCASYDPHTSFYNDVPAKDCIPGQYREIRGYDYINFFPRNDCWQNFHPNHQLITNIFRHPLFTNSSHPLDIVGSKVSFQSIINQAVNEVSGHNVVNDEVIFDQEEFSTQLNLLYLPEDWLATCSLWDRGDYGGPIHDIYKQLPSTSELPWGYAKYSYQEFLTFDSLWRETFPNASHLWLHSKEQEKEWKFGKPYTFDTSKKYYLSTWLYESKKELLWDEYGEDLQ